MVDEIEVRQLMTAPVVTLTRHQSIPMASELMKLERIRHLPVVDLEGHLVGIVTHRDLLAAQVSVLNALSADERAEVHFGVPVERVMKTHFWTVTPSTKVLEAARLMQDHAFGCLPVVDQGRLVGILTEADLLGFLVRSLGARRGQLRTPKRRAAK